jgi:hypothetical protein
MKPLTAKRIGFLNTGEITLSNKLKNLQHRLRNVGHKLCFKVSAALTPRVYAGHHRVDTSTRCCANPDCAYCGQVAWGNLRANGYPNGGPLTSAAV